MSSAMSAAEPLSPDARKSPPSTQVSLQTGWLLTLNRTPVYDAMKMATIAPMMLNALLTSIGMMPPPLFLIQASTAETVTKKPKARRAQTPTDIGDQYLKFRPKSPGVTSTIMCQNFHQLTPRSAVSKIGQSNVADRKSTRLNSSHLVISYAVFCLKKKKQKT